MHGYDPDLPSMQALFLARGPSFRRGAVVPGFENVHVYPLLAELLGVRPAPSDGRLDSLPRLLVGSAPSPPH
jgi:predicted AlkP superfamily pyrophosphatase or phosphodiesterase